MPMRQEKGFTAIELIIVTVMLALIIGVITPSFHKMADHYRLNIAARRLAEDVREVQQWSITLQETYIIKFYFDYKYYNVPTRGNNLLKQTVELPQGISFQEISYIDTSRKSQLTFDAKGAPNHGGHITLVNTQGEVRDVRITPIGRVKIYKER